MKEKRVQFATRLGVIATTVGSAVGLGNIWRFPYEAGEHGGGAFLLVYLFFVFGIGVPVICAEFLMGRHTQRNIFGAFAKLHKSKMWARVGYIGILSSILILSFYSVVAGWTLEYMFQSVSGALSNQTVEQLSRRFAEFSTSSWHPLMWTIIFLIINAGVLLRGVKKGIERMSNIMMPLLFVILVVFCVNSLMMPEALTGLNFLFNPDFTKVNPSMLIGAMGQAFFSLSIGLGTMMTYASYFNEKTPLVKSAVTTASLDTLVAILAGIVIFPAVFTFGVEPAAGPKLVFEVLPAIFDNLPAGIVWSTLFFLLLFLASLTSTISMSELCVAFFCEQLGMSRNKAVIVNAVIAIFLGTLCALSFGPLGDMTIMGKTIFDLFDFVSSNVLLPLGGMLFSIFVGWVIDRHIVKEELSGRGELKSRTLILIVFSLRYVAPVAIALVFLAGLGWI